MNRSDLYHAPKLKYYELTCVLCKHIFNGYYSDKDLKIQSACSACAYTLNIFDAYLHNKLYDTTLNPEWDHSDREYVARREMMDIVGHLIRDETLFLNNLKKGLKNDA